MRVDASSTVILADIQFPYIVYIYGIFVDLPSHLADLLADVIVSTIALSSRHDPPNHQKELQQRNTVSLPWQIFANLWPFHCDVHISLLALNHLEPSISRA